MRRVVLGVLALVLAGPVAPAHAQSGYGSVSGISGVLYDDCVDHAYRYAVEQPPGAGYWALDVVLVGPDGHQADSDYVPLPASGTSAFHHVCPPADTAGRYTIRATLQWGADENNVDQSSRFADAQFALRKPGTRTRLRVSTHRPAYGQRVTYTIGVRDERPTGYYPTAFAWVVLQHRVHGHWTRIRGSRTLTHPTGRVKLRLTYRHHHQPMRIRAVAQPSDRYARSRSSPVRLW